MAGNYNFSRSVSTDLGDVHPEPPARSNSEASGVQSVSPRQRRLSKEVGTSTSMVDLPLIQCSGEVYEFPTSSVKSHSVPRLANLIVNTSTGESEREREREGGREGGEGEREEKKEERGMKRGRRL